MMKTKKIQRTTILWALIGMFSALIQTFWLTKLIIDIRQHKNNK